MKTLKSVETSKLVSLKEQGMSYTEIANFFIEQGIRASYATVYQRLYRYYKSGGQEERKSTNVISDEQLYQLKEKGFTYREISEYLKSQGIQISNAGVNYRLNKYCEKIGKQKPNLRRVNVTDEQLYELREKGLSNRKISEYLKSQGIQISDAGVNYRLNKYCEKTGKQKPNLRRANVTDEQLYELIEKGLTYREISEYLKNEGVKISCAAVSLRLNEYCKKTGKQKPNPGARRIKVTDEQLYELKENGLADKEIVEYLIKQGIEISTRGVRYKINRYCEKTGKPKPNTQKVTDEQLYELKENGWTGREIARYLKSQGIEISYTSVNNRLNEYCKKTRKPMRTKVTDEQLYELKENGWTDKKIAEYLINQGIEISWATVNRRLNQYYKKIGKPKPNFKKTSKSKTESTAEVTDEQLYELREKGMTYREISEYLKSQGIEICSAKINVRVNEYCRRTGKTKIETRKAKVSIEKLYELKENGFSDKEIVEFLKKEGIEIAYTTISARLNKYYTQIGKAKPKCYGNKTKKEEKSNNKTKKNSVSRRKVTDEKLYELKEKGLTDSQIVEYFNYKGIKISYSNVSLRLTKYYKQLGKPKPRGNKKETREFIKAEKQAQEEAERKQQEKYIINLLRGSSSVIDIRIVNMLISGFSIKEKEFSDEQIQDINKRIEKLKFIARHTNKIGDRWIADENFIAVLDFLQNPQNTHPSNIYEVSIKKHLNGNTCQSGKIDLMKKNVFGDNEDLMTYVFLGTDITFDPEYDRKVWEVCKANYKSKIELYFARLQELEKRQREKNAETSRKLVKPGKER